MIAVIGQSVLDRTTWPDGRVEERVGGAPIFAARALADAWPAVVLTHGTTAELRAPLHDFGACVVAGPSARTTVFAVSLHGDGTWAESIVQFGDPFTPRDVAGWMAPALDTCSTVVCGTQWRNDFSPETTAALSAGGRRRVFLDGQGMARPARLGAIRLEGPFDPEAARGVDVLKLSECEADALIGGVEHSAASATGVPVVVVTLAERGAVVFAHGQATEITVNAVAGLTDTVGAGDSFLALMAAAADTGASPAAAARTACDGVARLLRRRLAAEHQWHPASLPVLHR